MREKKLIFGLKIANAEREKRDAELAVATNELKLQNIEKEKRAAELVIANVELTFQNSEKEKRAAELVIANSELLFQNNEKEKRASELNIANEELRFQNIEKENRAAELIIANEELTFQNKEKEKRAAELLIANAELAFQSAEKEKRAAELVIANRELAFQNSEKEKRAAELVIANNELAFQSDEKEKRAAELIIANRELLFQNTEKEKRAAELVIANTELAFENEEKEKRAIELFTANKELESFTFISSHDLQEPLRKIQTFSSLILTDEYDGLSEVVRNYFVRMQSAALHMQTLINDLLAYSRTSAAERKLELSDLSEIVDEVRIIFESDIIQKKAIINSDDLGKALVIPFQFRQLLQNLVGNALKFSDPKRPPVIVIKSKAANSKTLPAVLDRKRKYCHIIVSDNGIGFEQQYETRIFEIFQRLNNKKQYEGTGMGLTIVRKIVENHKGTITATGKIDGGAVFNIYIPA